MAIPQMEMAALHDLGPQALAVVTVQHSSGTTGHNDPFTLLRSEDPYKVTEGSTASTA